MRKVCLCIVVLISFYSVALGQNRVKTIHVFVVLCDNDNQGIVPVNTFLGNGQNPDSNLYWGALYGVKTDFNRSVDWTFVKTVL